LKNLKKGAGLKDVNVKKLDKSVLLNLETKRKREKEAKALKRNNIKKEEDK
jgi:hypothetical protein